MHTEAFFAQFDVVCQEIVKEYDVEFLSITFDIFFKITSVNSLLMYI